MSYSTQNMKKISLMNLWFDINLLQKLIEHFCSYFVKEYEKYHFSANIPFERI